MDKELEKETCEEQCHECGEQSCNCHETHECTCGEECSCHEEKNDKRKK